MIAQPTPRAHDSVCTPPHEHNEQDTCAVIGRALIKKHLDMLKHVRVVVVSLVRHLSVTTALAQVHVYHSAHNDGQDANADP